nr:hypothetical protein [Tanacetum cinerariifolium]
CKKQTMVANSTTEAEYVAASSCCSQVLWIQNQLLGYGDSNEKKLIQMIKIHTDKNVFDLLTKEFNEECLEWNGKAAKDKIGINLLLLVMVNAVEVYTSCIEQLWTTAKAKNINGEAQIHALVDRKKDTKETQPSGSTTNVEDEAFNEENVSKHSNDPLHSGKDRIQLKVLKEICTNLQQRVFDLETTKTSQALEIKSLKKKVKRLEKKRRSRTHGLKRLYKVGLSARVESFTDEECLGEEDASKQGRIFDIDANQDIYLVNVHRDKDIFEVDGKDVSAVEEVNNASIATSVTATNTTAATTPTISMDEITLSKALIKIKTSRPKAKEIVMQEPSETPTPTPIVSSQQPSKVQDESKEIMVEEPLKMKKKDQILFDEEVARKLQEKIYEQERLVGERARQKEEANSALIKTWEDIQAKVSTKKDKAETALESSSKRAGDELAQEKSKKQKCDLSGSGFSFLLAVASFFSGSGKFFWQWKLCNWQWECLIRFVDPDHPEKVYRLRKALYGLKQAPRACGFSFLLAVASFFSGSGKFFWQWELYNWQWEFLVQFIPNNPPLNLMLYLQSSFQNKILFLERMPLITLQI